MTNPERQKKSNLKHPGHLGAGRGVQLFPRQRSSQGGMAKRGKNCDAQVWITSTDQWWCLNHTFVLTAWSAVVVVWKASIERWLWFIPCPTKVTWLWGWAGRHCSHSRSRQVGRFSCCNIRQTWCIKGTLTYLCFCSCLHKRRCTLRLK